MNKETPQSAEINPGPGFQVRLDIHRPDPALMRSLAEFETPEISDMLNRLYAVDGRIRCLTGHTETLYGPACTVRVYPGDNLMVHKCLDVVRPGDVVVIDAHGSHGSEGNAVLGDIIATKARHRGIAGFIVDGLIRDLPGVIETGLPVYARGTTPIGPLHRGPGEINFPIACGGVVIHPGDVMVADQAGIVAVPQHFVADLLARLEAKRERSAAYLAGVQRGQFSNAWVDQLLEKTGCLILGKPPAEE